jgi:hypothetical protein
MDEFKREKGVFFFAVQWWVAGSHVGIAFTSSLKVSSIVQGLSIVIFTVGVKSCFEDYRK